MVFILINSVIMAIDHYGISKKTESNLYYANMVLTIVFAIEMVVKIFGLGIKEYLRDGFNIFDATIIIIGLLEYVGIGA